MSTQNHTALQTRARGTLVIGAALASILVLAGCTPNTPKPSDAPHSSAPLPTPTSTKADVAAPKSEQEAIKIAQSTATRFVAIDNAVAVAGGTNSDRYSAVAIDPALSNAITGAKAIADNHYVITGASSITFQSAYATALTSSSSNIPFGSVTIQSCYDSSGRPVKNADGSAAPQPPSLRTTREINVVYDPTNRGWFIRTFLNSGTSC